MTLESIYFISQIVAVVAILASVVFVGLQIRQSNQAAGQANDLARAELTLIVLNEATAFSDRFIASTELASLRLKIMNDDKTLSDEEQVQAYYLIYKLISIYEKAYRLHCRNLIETETYVGLTRVLPTWDGPKFRRWWERNKVIYGPTFIAEIDRILAESSLNPVSQPQGKAS